MPENFSAITFERLSWLVSKNFQVMINQTDIHAPYIRVRLLKTGKIVKDEAGPSLSLLINDMYSEIVENQRSNK